MGFLGLLVFIGSRGSLCGQIAALLCPFKPNSLNHHGFACWWQRIGPEPTGNFSQKLCNQRLPASLKPQNYTINGSETFEQVFRKYSRAVYFKNTRRKQKKHDKRKCPDEFTFSFGVT